MKKVLVSLLIGVSLFSVGCGGIKEGVEKELNSAYKSGYLNINIDMENYREQFYEGAKIRGKGIISSNQYTSMPGIRYITYMNKENPLEQFLEFNYDDYPKIYEDYNLHMGDYVYFEGILNEEKEIKIEYLKIIDSPTEALK